MKKIMIAAMAFVMAFAANAERDEVVIESDSGSVYDSIYFGAGAGGRFLNNDTDNRKSLIGSVVLGGGKVFNKFYVGGEFDVDFTKKLKFSDDDGKGNVSELKINGFTPKIAVRFGYNLNRDMLVFGRLGCAWHKVSGNFERTGFKSVGKSINRPGVILGLGFERAFGNKFSTALEAEYDFGVKYEIDDLYNVQTKKKEKVSGRLVRGWNVRALVKYNVKY